MDQRRVDDGNLVKRVEIMPQAVVAWRRHLGDEPFDPEDLRRRLAAGSLVEALTERSKATPSVVAVTIDGQAATYGELEEGAARAGGWLLQRDVRAGDRVILSAQSSVLFVKAYLGILRIGAIAVPLDPNLADAEVDYLIADADPGAILADADILERLSRQLKNRRVPIGWLDEESLSGPPAAVRPLSTSGLLGYTSGTTGRPKGALLTEANLVASIRGAMLAWRWQPDDVLVHALPLTHQHGLSGVHATILAGSEAFLLSKFDPRQLIRAMQSKSATVLFAVPAMYQRLCMVPEVEFMQVPSLRLAVSGSAPLGPGLAERVRLWIGELPVERYGSTESGLNISNLYAGHRLVGHIGYPLPGVEVDVDAATGELLVRGPQVFHGYWRRDADTSAAFTADGFFRTGDAGRVDTATGAFEITGRLKELIISGGLNVYPSEVERALLLHPLVDDVAVAGRPSDHWGEEVVAYVVSRELADESGLSAHCRRYLAAYKCPKRFVFVDQLPRTRLGKLDKARLEDLEPTADRS
jgi:malonyl-CoA/methylmalonyl-CoA synthetase